MAKTPAQLGMQEPVGTDFISEGDNAITKNAQASAEWISKLLTGLFEPVEIVADDDLSSEKFRVPGWFYCRLSTTAATVLNRPPGLPGTPFMVHVAETPFGYCAQDYYGYSGTGEGRFGRNTSDASGTVFIPWRRLDNETVTAAGTAGVANALRLQEFRDAIGPVNTNGLGAIALRFDHGLSNFDSKMRGPLDTRSIKYSLALSSRNFDAGENAGVTAAMVDSWTNAEVWNHGANPHQDESSIGGLMDQIVTGKHELEDLLPNKPIWGYAVPGTGGTGQGGFGGGATPEAFYSTLAGDLILTNHAVSSGSFSGSARRPLDGRVRQGMAHFTIEAQTVSRIKIEVDHAISNRVGVQLMMHPSLLDTAGHLTTAQFTEVLDYIAAKRDAGELVVLSPYEMMVADAAVDANAKIAAIEAKNVSQDTAIANAQHYMGALPLNTNLIGLPAKVSAYAVSSATAAAQIVPALPAGFANIGFLEVGHASSGGGGYRLFKFTTIGGSSRGVHEIELQAGVFTAWRRTDHHTVAEGGGPRTVPNGTNIDTLIRSGGAYDGDWTTFTDIATNGITGIPAGETSLFNLRVRGGTGFQEIEFYQGGLYWRPIINAATSAFGPWVRLDQPQTAPTTTEYALEREVRTARAKQRVGGKIGTSGLPAFALRFDDWADDMQNTVMPELRSRNLCAGWAATVAYVENPQQGLPSTWPTVGEWVRDGVELMGHSWTHVNASGDANIRHEIIESADYIESMVPAATIDTWTMPGTSAGANTYDGFGIGDKLANYYSTPAGRMILQRYPIVGGAIPGRFLPLVGEPSIGRVHLTIDTLTAASVIADMEKARDAGVGFQLMNHPIHIGKTDKITLADFRAILDWLAAERDAGRVEVLTPRGIAYADSSSSERLNTVPDVDQWTGWNQRTDWTAESGYITTTTGGVMVRALNMTAYGYLRGGIVEVAARVRTPTGAVVRTGISGGAERSVDHTLPASTEWKWVRTVATIPNNLTNSASLVASIGRVSGGQVDIERLAVRPV